jgi:hypothetical protein
MSLVKTFHIHPETDPLREGEFTFGLGTPAPRYVTTGMSCPFCGSPLSRCTNTGRLRIHRVAKITGKRRNGETPYLASAFPSQTHHFFGCRMCKIGFSTLKKPKLAGGSRG